MHDETLTVTYVQLLRDLGIGQTYRRSDDSSRRIGALFVARAVRHPVYLRGAHQLYWKSVSPLGCRCDRKREREKREFCMSQSADKNRTKRYRFLKSFPGRGRGRAEGRRVRRLRVYDRGGTVGREEVDRGREKKTDFSALFPAAAVKCDLYK